MTTRGIGQNYVEIEKQGFWRGTAHQWVNRYVISGVSLPSTGDMTSVINGLKAIEDKVHPQVAAGAGVGFVEGRFYGATGGPPALTVPYNASLTPGSATGFGGPTSAYTSLYNTGTLETCLEVRTLMEGLSTSGKAVYARKFFRGIMSYNEGIGDFPIAPGDITAINTSTATWKTGVGGTSYVVIGTSGRLMSGTPTAQNQITNHQVPRGRKRISAAKTTALAGASGFASGYISGVAAPTPPASSSGGSTISILSGNDFPIFP